MSEKNTSVSSSGCGCLIWIIVIILLCQYCSREDKDKTMIQTTIDYVHEQYMYADSIFGKK
jgi:hypothetical protein